MTDLFTTETPTLPNVNETVPVTVGTGFYVTAAAACDGAEFLVPTTVGSGTYELRLFQITADDSPAGTGTGTLLASATPTGVVAGQWASASWAPVTLTPNTVAYKICLATSEGRYAATGGGFNSVGMSNGGIVAWVTGTNPVGLGPLDNGSFTSGLVNYANNTFNGNQYFVGPKVTFTPVTTPFTKDVDLLWRVLNAFTKDTSIPWNVRNAFVKDVSMVWDVLAGTAFTKDVVASWNVRALFTKDTVATWNVRANFTKDIVFRWSVGSSGLPTWSLWDGSQEIPLTLDGVWNGTTIVPANTEFS